ncbi:hypothetical protein KIPB_014232, partial [Kipferlia bialata]
LSLAPVDECLDPITGQSVALSVIHGVTTEPTQTVLDTTTAGWYVYEDYSASEGLYEISMSYGGVTKVSNVTVSAAYAEVEGEYFYVSGVESSLTSLPTVTGDFSAVLVLRDTEGVLVPVDVSPLVTIDGVDLTVQWDEDSSSYTVSGQACSLATLHYEVKVGTFSVLTEDVAVVSYGPLSQTETVFSATLLAAIGDSVSISVEPKDACGNQLPTTSVDLSIMSGPSPFTVIHTSTIETSGVFYYTHSPAAVGTYTVTATVDGLELESVIGGNTVEFSVLESGTYYYPSSSMSQLANLPDSAVLGGTMTGEVTLRDPLGVTYATELPLTVEWDDGVSGSVTFDSVHSAYAVSLTVPSSSSAVGIR